MSGLETGLQRAEEQARSLRERLRQLPPEAADLGQLGEHGELIRGLLADCLEAAKQLAVAGLAYPDPELADELISLAARARRHGLPAAVRILLRLHTYLTALKRDPSDSERVELAAAAWEETQRFIAWLRLFRIEMDFLFVQAQLSSSANHASRPSAELPRVSVSVWPAGADLRARGRLTVWGTGLDGEHVEIHDDLAEFDGFDPVRGEVISRVFQDRLPLQQILGAVIRFDDHPVVLGEDGTLLLRADFKARPRLRRVTSSFKEPELPTLSPSAMTAVEDLPERPHRMELVAARSSQALVLRTRAGDAVPVQGSDLLRFTFTKLLIREASHEERFEATLLPGREGLRVIAARTEFDGRVFPHLDPCLFTLDPVVVAKRAERDPVRGVEGAWLRTAAFLCGGAELRAVEALREDLAGLEARGILEHYRLGLCRAMLGAQGAPGPAMLRCVERTLSVAARDRSAPIDEEALADVLGRSAATPSDLHHLDGSHVLAALWLSLSLDLEATQRGLYRQLLHARYAGQLTDPSWADVCVRALLVHFSDDTEAVEETDETEASASASEGLDFFMAHLAGLQRGRGKRAMPLPTLIELLQLGDTLARLLQQDPLGAIVRPLGLPPERLRQPVLEALYQWTVAGPESPELRRLAGDALAVLLASGVRAWFVS